MKSTSESRLLRPRRSQQDLRTAVRQLKVGDFVSAQLRPAVGRGRLSQSWTVFYGTVVEQGGDCTVTAEWAIVEEVAGTCSLLDESRHMKRTSLPVCAGIAVGEIKRLISLPTTGLAHGITAAGSSTVSAFSAMHEIGSIVAVTFSTREGEQHRRKSKTIYGNVIASNLNTGVTTVQYALVDDGTGIIQQLIEPALQTLPLAPTQLKLRMKIEQVRALEVLPQPTAVKTCRGATSGEDGPTSVLAGMAGLSVTACAEKMSDQPPDPAEHLAIGEHLALLHAVGSHVAVDISSMKGTRRHRHSFYGVVTAVDAATGAITVQYELVNNGSGLISMLHVQKTAILPLSERQRTAGMRLEGVRALERLPRPTQLRRPDDFREHAAHHDPDAAAPLQSDSSDGDGDSDPDAPLQDCHTDSDEEASFSSLAVNVTPGVKDVHSQTSGAANAPHPPTSRRRGRTEHEVDATTAAAAATAHVPAAPAPQRQLIDTYPGNDEAAAVRRSHYMRIDELRRTGWRGQLDLHYNRGDPKRCSARCPVGFSVCIRPRTVRCAACANTPEVTVMPDGTVPHFDQHLPEVVRYMADLYTTDADPAWERFTHRDGVPRTAPRNFVLCEATDRQRSLRCHELFITQHPRTKQPQLCPRCEVKATRPRGVTSNATATVPCPLCPPGRRGTRVRLALVEHGLTTHFQQHHRDALLYVADTAPDGWVSCQLRRHRLCPWLFRRVDHRSPEEERVNPTVEFNEAEVMNPDACDPIDFYVCHVCRYVSGTGAAPGTNEVALLPPTQAIMSLRFHLLSDAPTGEAGMAIHRALQKAIKHDEAIFSPQPLWEQCPHCQAPLLQSEFASSPCCKHGTYVLRDEDWPAFDAEYTELLRKHRNVVVPYGLMLQSLFQLIRPCYDYCPHTFVSAPPVDTPTEMIGHPHMRSDVRAERLHQGLQVRRGALSFHHNSDASNLILAGLMGAGPVSDNLLWFTDGYSEHLPPYDVAQTPAFQECVRDLSNYFGRRHILAPVMRTIAERRRQATYGLQPTHVLVHPKKGRLNTTGDAPNAVLAPYAPVSTDAGRFRPGDDAHGRTVGPQAPRTAVGQLIGFHPADRPIGTAPMQFVPPGDLTLEEVAMLAQYILGEELTGEIAVPTSRESSAKLEMILRAVHVLSRVSGRNIKADEDLPPNVRRALLMYELDLSRDKMEAFVLTLINPTGTGGYARRNLASRDARPRSTANKLFKTVLRFWTSVLYQRMMDLAWAPRVTEFAIHLAFQRAYQLHAWQTSVAGTGRMKHVVAISNRQAQQQAEAVARQVDRQANAAAAATIGQAMAVRAHAAEAALARGRPRPAPADVLMAPAAGAPAPVVPGAAAAPPAAAQPAAAAAAPGYSTDGVNGRNVYALPKTTPIVDNPQEQREKIADSLAIAASAGQPAMMITLTFGINWIEERILNEEFGPVGMGWRTFGQMPNPFYRGYQPDEEPPRDQTRKQAGTHMSDRVPTQNPGMQPFLTDRIFRDRLRSVKAWLSSVVGTGFELTWWISGEESQQKGLRHAHINIRMRNPRNEGTADDGKETPALRAAEDVDYFVSARLFHAEKCPNRLDKDADCPCMAHELYRIVSKVYVHNCRNSDCLKEVFDPKTGTYVKKCSDNFPWEETPQTMQDKRIKRWRLRRGPEDHNVVPYSPIFTLLFRCHINVMPLLDGGSLSYPLFYQVKHARVIIAELIVRDPADPTKVKALPCKDRCLHAQRRKAMCSSEALPVVIGMDPYTASRKVKRLHIFKREILFEGDETKKHGARGEAGGDDDSDESGGSGCDDDEVPTSDEEDAIPAPPPPAAAAAASAPEPPRGLPPPMPVLASRKLTLTEIVTRALSPDGDFLWYLDRPLDPALGMAELKFTEFYVRYTVKRQNGAVGKPAVQTTGVSSGVRPERYAEAADAIGQRRYIHRLPADRVVRLKGGATPIDPNRREEYALSLIVRNSAPTSIADLLRKPDNTLATTFTEAAHAKGLLCDQYCRLAIEEFINDNVPRSQWRRFAPDLEDLHKPIVSDDESGDDEDATAAAAAAADSSDEDEDRPRRPAPPQHHRQMLLRCDVRLHKHRHAQIVNFFVQIIMQDPHEALALFNRFHRFLASDNPALEDCTKFSKERALANVQARLMLYWKLTSDYGLGTTSLGRQERIIEAERAKWSRDQMQMIVDNARRHLSDEQRELSQWIVNAVRQHQAWKNTPASIRGAPPPARDRVAIVQGAGGSGKTTAVKAAFAQARLELNALMCETSYTGNSSLRYTNGMTCHGYFGLPIMEHEKMMAAHPLFPAYRREHPIRDAVLQHADGIVMDEAGMLPFPLLDFADHLATAVSIGSTPETLGNDALIFGGKVIVIIADPKQCAAVGPKTDAEAVAAAIPNARCWQHARHFHLRMDQRLAAKDNNSVQFRAWQRALGLGEYPRRPGEDPATPPRVYDGRERIPLPPFARYTDDVNHLIDDFLGPNDAHALDPRALAEKVILSCRNRTCEDLNALIRHRIAAKTKQEIVTKHAYYEAATASAGSAGQRSAPGTGARADAFRARHTGDTGGVIGTDRAAAEEVRNLSNAEIFAMLLDADALDKQQPSGVAEAKLALFIGQLVIIMRNMNLLDGIANGMTAVVRAIANTFVTLQLYCPDLPHLHNTEVYVTRCRFPLPQLGINRRQFPLRTAYCRTPNRVQSCTWGKVSIDTRDDCLAHGQPYTSVTRGNDVDGYLFLVPKESPWLVNRISISNIVSQSLLASFNDPSLPPPMPRGRVVPDEPAAGASDSPARSHPTFADILDMLYNKSDAADALEVEAENNGWIW